MKVLLLLLLPILPAAARLSAQPVPVFRVQADTLRAFTSDQKAKMKQALDLFEHVMNDTAFQRELAGLTFHYEPDDPDSLLTTAQAITRLYAAHEEYTAGPDGVASIRWRIKRPVNPFSSSVGYGQPGQPWIYTYTSFINRESVTDIAGHLAHEWSHKLGFEHSHDYDELRDESLPYLFGELVSKHALRLINMHWPEAGEP